jgi:hypothetical protein
MFRGLGKFVVVAVVAALVGAAIGVGLAALTDSSDEPAASVPATTAAAPAPSPATQTQPAAPPPPPPGETQTQTETEPPTTTATPAKLVGPVPKVRIASATIGEPAANGHALVTAKVTVTNRYSAALPSETPTLISDADQVPLDTAGKKAAGPLLNTLDPDASATGELRFTLPSAVARRLRTTPTAKLRIAGRTVAMKLTPAG